MKPYYERGGITIYQGDALDVLPQLRAHSFGLVVTDPPYIIGAVSAGNIGQKAGGWADMMNSALWFATWYRMARRLLTADGALWTCCNWRSLPVVMRAAQDAEWGISSVLVWHKDWIGPGGPIGLRPAYELVALMGMPEFAIPDRGVPDVWTVPWSSQKPNGHPAEKPVKLMGRIIQESGLGAAAVCDPFMGSGTTLVSCKRLGIAAVGIEADERWCEVAANRLQQDALPLEMPA
jgi:DNA modification methylase